MNWRFTISRKLGLGFGLFIAVVGILFLLTSKTVQQSKSINQRINDNYSPSVAVLKDFDNLISRSLDLQRQWANIQSREDMAWKIEAIRVCDTLIPREINLIHTFYGNWQEPEQLKFDTIVDLTNQLLAQYAITRQKLPTHESYEDPFLQMTAEFEYYEGEQIPMLHSEIKRRLKDLTLRQQEYQESEISRMNESFSTLNTLMINIATGVVIAGVLIAFFLTRSIVRPVNSVRRKLMSLSQGIYSAQKVIAGNDEVGDMANAVEVLISNFEKTKEFSMQLGAGNFDVDFNPLSEHDELGKALIRMRADLAAYRNEMEDLVSGQTAEIRMQNDRLEEQTERVTELYNDLQASIRYAQRLQQSILPGDEYVKTLFPESFVFFKPKATVSGDFYWFKMLGGKKIFAAADCTGHGVPGAFMSLVGHNVLNQVTKVYTQPSQILNNLNRMAGEVIRSRSDEENLRDGMDVALCALDPETLQLEYSGAHNPVYLVRDGELIQMESDPYSIGSFNSGEKEYTNQSFQLQPNDCLYLFSDGYADQFGGPRGKKFMRKQFRMLLLAIVDLPMKEQRDRIEETFEKWRGEENQVDDILVMGIRI